MRRVLLGFCVFAAIALAGCGGGVGGGGGLDTLIVGTWQPVSATNHDTHAFVMVGTALGWPADWTREEQEFVDDGTCTRTAWDGSTVVSTIDGAWSSNDGVAPVTFGGVNMVYNYVQQGDRLYATISRGGSTYDTVWVRVRNISDPGFAPDSRFVRTVRIIRVLVNGVEPGVESFYHLESGQQMTLQLFADGTRAWRALDDGDVITRTDGWWMSGDGEMVFVSDLTTRMSIDPNGLTYLDDDGNTIQLIWTNWAGGADSRPDELVHPWLATSVAVDGSPVPLATYFGWEPGTTDMFARFWADGTVESTDSNDVTLLGSTLGTWGVVAGKLQVNFGAPMVGDYSVAGNTLTYTIADGGSTTVITFEEAGVYY